jgi:hypothetical protein
LPSFNRANSYISFLNNSGLWQASSQSAATGSSPYVQTLNGVVLNSSFSSFGVASNNQLNEQTTYTINASAGGNGSISPSGLTTVSANATQRFTFTPNMGYKVDSVIIDGNKVDSIIGYTFNNITSNRSIRVTFTPIIYTIFAQTDPNGTINPSGNINIAYGATQRFLFTPNSGYTIDSVIVDGIKIDSMLSYTFSNVISNRINHYAIFKIGDWQSFFSVIPQEHPKNKNAQYKVHYNSSHHHQHALPSRFTS